MALQHLRSSTANKRPTPAAMSDGQLAMNTNLASPGLFFKDSNGDSVKIGPVHVGTTAPNVTPGAGGQAGNSVGEAWLDTTAANPILKVFNGSAFVAVQPVGTGTVVSTTDTGTVTSTMILDGTILNADINASAAIAGTKISPDFGSQTVTTTGVVSAALASAATPSLTFTGDLNTGIFSPGADQVAISTNGTGRLHIDSAGNVGIGTSSPGTKLEVNGDILSPGRGTSFGYKLPDCRVFNPSSGGIFAIDDYTNTRFFINSSGLVGIGTTSPSDSQGFGNALEMRGSTGSAYYSATSDNATRAYFATFTGGGFAGTETNHPLIIRTNNTERARIDTSGRLLVGIIASPAHQLQVSTDSAGKPSTNTWTIVSDERIKEEIELADLDLCYAAVKTIPLKRFKWKDEVYTEKQVRDRRKLGWIAQDVEAVFPKAVGTYEFKYNQVFEETIVPAVKEELDDEGNVTTPAQPERIEKGDLISEDVIEDCRDLNSDQLYAAMYGAIQKLMVKVETLEAEVAALKAN